MSPLVQKKRSPLILASLAGDLEIVQGMVELGADISHPTNVRERERETVEYSYLCVLYYRKRGLP